MALDILHKLITSDEVRGAGGSRSNPSVFFILTDLDQPSRQAHSLHPLFSHTQHTQHAFYTHITPAHPLPPPPKKTHQVVVVKMNPVNDYLGPLLRRAFKPFADKNWVEFAYGGPGGFFGRGPLVLLLPCWARS